ncbi:hypothetical protein COP1_002682 [Malus domestica]
MKQKAACRKYKKRDCGAQQEKRGIKKKEVSTRKRIKEGGGSCLWAARRDARDRVSTGSCPFGQRESGESKGEGSEAETGQLEHEVRSQAAFGSLTGRTRRGQLQKIKGGQKAGSTAALRQKEKKKIYKKRKMRAAIWQLVREREKLPCSTWRKEHGTAGTRSEGRGERERQ